MRTKVLKCVYIILLILVCAALVAVANLRGFKNHGWMINTTLESTELVGLEGHDHPSPKVANVSDSYRR